MLLFLTMAALSKRQVLLVDDDPAIRACIAMLLAAGYDVAAAEDGLEALLLLDKSTPDIVVSDLNMPRMSGVVLLSEIRRRFPQIVTIAMSGAYRNSDELPPEVIAHGLLFQRGAPQEPLWNPRAAP
jgi:CheY-like chemotaxis protein